ncbi:unnamed protein product [Colias eurytheme]|nr:unnamed protein product [Colias eurytheme]
MGFSQKIKMVDGVLPSKFHCQPDRCKRICDPGTCRSAFAKQQRIYLIEQCEAEIFQPAGTEDKSHEGKMEDIITGHLEVCIDSLESAVNAINGGASELEVCSSLAEGGLTPSPGLVLEILNIVNKIRTSRKNCEETKDGGNENILKVNIMIRCRGGSDFNYSESEMATMLADVRHYKEMSVDSFVFGALNETRGIDKENCSRIIAEAHPIPVTFHRAFDLCSEPINVAIKEIIRLGFKRLLTSGQKQTVADEDALKLINHLQFKYGDEIEIMPGSGVTIDNVKKFIDMGCKFVHSSCKVVNKFDELENDLGMGSGKRYVTSEDVVRSMVQIIS